MKIKSLNWTMLALLLILALAFAGCAPATTAPIAAPPTQAAAPTSAPPPTQAAATSGAAPTTAAAAAPVPTFATNPADLTVFAAASLTDAFKEIGQMFEASHPGVKVDFNFAGSQQLRAHMEQGAKADVFASANTTEMDNARKSGLVGNDDEIFVTNRLQVITPKDNSGNIKELKDLANPNLKLVIADKSVPVGGYALQMLDKMSADPAYGADFGPSVLKNVVSQENNVKAVVNKVQLGEADAGIVYLTDVTPDAAKQVSSIDVPDKFNVVARYPIAALKDAPNADLAKQFVALVLAADGGQKVMDKWHFVPAAPEVVATKDITIVDASGKKTVMTTDQLMALPQTQVKGYALVGKTRGPLGTADYTGAALKDVLLKADPTLSATNVMSVTVVAGDGFKVSVSGQEAFDPPADKPTILAYIQDGQPMTPIQGFVRLLISSYDFADRQAKWVKELDIVRAK